MSKTALVFGSNGQDGSYLCELLVDQGYEKVVAAKRRSSTDTTGRLEEVRDDIVIAEADLTDPSSVNKLISHYRPDEIYNLAAQSHVGTSFEQPSFTFQVNAVGVLNILEGIRTLLPSAKFYQASTSEMFGDNFTVAPNYQNEVEYLKLGSDEKTKKYQDEDTRFSPRSPYAVAKMAAHNLVHTYRESYGIHASCGILFNHETLTYGTPLITKDSKGIVNILPIGDIARFCSGVSFDMDKDYQEGSPTNDIWVWDNNDWTKVKYISGYSHKGNKNPRIVNSRNSVYAATGSHVCIMDDDSEKKTSELKTGDKVKMVGYPAMNDGKFNVGLEEAKWMGMMVGDGNLHSLTPRFTNKDMKVKKEFVSLWKGFVIDGSAKYRSSKSGFTGDEIGQVECFGKYDRVIDMYTDEVNVFGHKTKKVPCCILNSNKDVMEAFLVGYNICDGLKKNPCKYRFKNFKTNSHCLAAGLLYLIHHVTSQRFNITVEESWKYGKQQFYYSINLLSDNTTSMEKYLKVMEHPQLSSREMHKKTGISRSFILKVKRGYVPFHSHHLEKTSNEIKKIIEIPNYSGWFFDLETESGTFHAGAGNGIVHNSERRGENFVTRKITKYVAGLVLKAHYQLGSHVASYTTLSPNDTDPLALGNLDARRDWGHAEDYVRAMWLMLQQEKPDDYVVAMGETLSVRDFLTSAFGFVGIKDWEPYVVIDPKFYRPADVEFLLGRPDKARRVLGWEPEVSFDQLVERMLLSDLQQISAKAAQEA